MVRLSAVLCRGGRNWKRNVSRGEIELLEVQAVWALQDSNLEPTDYESGALTVELRARYEAKLPPGPPRIKRTRSLGA